MKKQWTNIFILAFSTIIVFIYLFHSNMTKETIIFFPIDPLVYFEHASTHLLTEPSNDSAYSLQWKVNSTLSEPAYLRQDVSLLYKNGQLTAILKKWEQHKQSLTQIQEFREKDSARYDAITFHYAEVHHDEKQYTSVQQMSKAQKYIIIDPSYSAFKSPISDEQHKWKTMLDNSISAKINLSLQNAIEHFQIKDQYQVIPLTELLTKANEVFRKFPIKKQEEIIGKLWEGIYKQYALGVNKNGIIVSPEGSSIPQLLIANDYHELLILFTLKDGTPIMLRQQLPS